MSGEEAVAETVETNAEVVENTEVTEVPETSEQSSEVTLENIYSMSDDQLDEYLANGNLASDSDSEASTSEQIPDEATEQAEPVEVDEEEESESEVDGDESESETIDTQAVYEELFNNPIKAGGREITIDSVDEAKRLIQQGVDYHKKMQEFSPFKKAMNLLKKRDALDPEKLDFLLDVAEGKPEAVSKLLKDQNLDPYDIDVDAGDKYVSEYKDTEVLDNLNEVFATLPSGEPKVQTLEILSKGGWDDTSRQEIFDHPESIREIHRQIQDGTYATIMAVLDKKRALGDLVGMGDLQAYNMVGTELENQGKLGVPNTPTESTNSPQTKKQANPALNEKRRKASGAPRNAPSNVQSSSEQFNPATASEEALDKFLQNHLRNAAG